MQHTLCSLAYTKPSFDLPSGKFKKPSILSAATDCVTKFPTIVTKKMYNKCCCRRVASRLSDHDQPSVWNVSGTVLFASLYGGFHPHA